MKFWTILFLIRPLQVCPWAECSDLDHQVLPRRKSEDFHLEHIFVTQWHCNQWQEYLMRAHFGLPSVVGELNEGKVSLQPFLLNFSLTMHLVDFSTILYLIDLSLTLVFGWSWCLSQPPINVKFEIPYFTTSGIQVRTMLRLNSPEVVGEVCDGSTPMAWTQTGHLTLLMNADSQYFWLYCPFLRSATWRS